MNRRPHGDGSIFLDAQGRWVAQVELGRDLRGKRLRKRKTASTRAEAVRLLREMTAAKSGDRLVSSDRLTFRSLAEEWLRDGIHSSVRETTRRDYEDLLRRYVIPAFSNVRLVDISHERLARWQGLLIDDGKSINTTKRARQACRAVLAYAVRRHLLLSNPFESLPGPRRQLGDSTAVREPLSLDEAQALLACARGTALDGVICLALTTGLRRGEILAIKWDDIRLEVGELSVRGTLRESTRRLPDGSGATELVLNPPKTRSSARRVMLLPQAASALMRQQLQQKRWRLAAGASWNGEGYVFTDELGHPLWPSSVSKRYSRLLAANGLRHVRFHDLRHTVAVLMLEAGAPLEAVSDALGHSSIQITKDVYAGHVQKLSDRAFEHLGAAYSTGFTEPKRAAAGAGGAARADRPNHWRGDS